MVHLAEAIEYVDCISAECKDPHPPNECPRYDTKHSEVSVMLEFGGIGVPFCWHCFQVHFSPVAPDMVPSMDQIELFDIWTVLTQNWIVWNRTIWSFNCV